MRCPRRTSKDLFRAVHLPSVSTCHPTFTYGSKKLSYAQRQHPRKPSQQTVQIKLRVTEGPHTHWWVRGYTPSTWRLPLVEKTGENNLFQWWWRWLKQRLELGQTSKIPRSSTASQASSSESGQKDKMHTKIMIMRHLESGETWFWITAVRLPTGVTGEPLNLYICFLICGMEIKTPLWSTSLVLWGSNEIMYTKCFTNLKP